MGPWVRALSLKLDRCGFRFCLCLSGHVAALSYSFPISKAGIVVALASVSMKEMQAVTDLAITFLLPEGRTHLPSSSLQALLLGPSATRRWHPVTLLSECMMQRARRALALSPQLGLGPWPRALQEQTPYTGRAGGLHWAGEVRAGPRRWRDYGGGREGAFVWVMGCLLFVCCFGRPERRPEQGYL